MSEAICPLPAATSSSTLLVWRISTSRPTIGDSRPFDSAQSTRVRTDSDCSTGGHKIVLSLDLEVTNMFEIEEVER